MGKVTVDQRRDKNESRATAENPKPGERPNWETPRMEDVSEQVMAQPYIRFT